MACSLCGCRGWLRSLVCVRFVLLSLFVKWLLQVKSGRPTGAPQTRLASGLRLAPKT